MAKTFRDRRVDEQWPLPPSVKELVPADDAAHSIRELVRDELDLSAILDMHDEERGPCWLLSPSTGFSRGVRR
jgi:hypothetical protein